MDKTAEKLVRLIEENPDLPIIPMVETEVVEDDYYSTWMGSLGYCQLDEYILFPKGRARGIAFKSDDEVFDNLEDWMSEEEFESLPGTEEECRPYWEALPWKKAIVVYITTPEE